MGETEIWGRRLALQASPGRAPGWRDVVLGSQRYWTRAPLGPRSAQMHRSCRELAEGEDVPDGTPPGTSPRDVASCPVCHGTTQGHRHQQAALALSVFTLQHKARPFLWPVVAAAALEEGTRHRCPRTGRSPEGRRDSPQGRRAAGWQSRRGDRKSPLPTAGGLSGCTVTLLSVGALAGSRRHASQCHLPAR